jgi:hypothetical protein
LWLIYVAPKRFGSQAPQPTGFALLVEALVTWSWEIHGIKGPELIAVTMDVPKKNMVNYRLNSLKWACLKMMGHPQIN